MRLGDTNGCYDNPPNPNGADRREENSTSIFRVLWVVLRTFLTVKQFQRSSKLGKASSNALIGYKFLYNRRLRSRFEPRSLAPRR